MREGAKEPFAYSGFAWDARRENFHKWELVQRELRNFAGPLIET
jgi:hypothetical protein